jgi:hypothetical protein
MSQSEEAPESRAPRPRDATAGLFFRKVEPLTPEAHGGLGLIDPITYGFARRSNVIPLNAVEFVPACRHYPIVFNVDDAGEPLALVGVRGHRNLFVEENGAWAEGCYIPAFVRRHPFVLTSAGGKSIALCVDVESPIVAQGGKRALFREGKPTELMRRVAEFCAAFAREQAKTRRLVEALAQRGLLIERAVDIRQASGDRLAFRGIRVVDEAAFRRLSDADLALFWREGWLSMVYAHLASLGNFGRLFNRDRRLGPVQ